MNRIVKKDTDSDGVEINIMYVFGLLIRRLWLLMLVGLIVGASCAGITKLVEEPTYTSSMTFIVNNKSEMISRPRGTIPSPITICPPPLIWRIPSSIL